MKKILITRPEKQAEDMAKEIDDMGFETLCAPVLKVEELSFEIPENLNNKILLFTSSNAVKIFAKSLNDNHVFFSKPVFCVGDKTAQTARENNFINVQSADGKSEDLCRMIKDNHKSENSYLHIRGHHVAQPLHVWLAEFDIKADIVHVYKTHQIDEWNDDVINAFNADNIQAVIHMSPRSAEAYIKMIQKYALENAHKNIKSLSISPAVLKCLQSLHWKKQRAAKQPNKAELYELIRKECVAQ